MFIIDITFYILIITYTSIVYEIAVLPVPSVASTYQLLFINKVDAAVIKYDQDGLLRNVRKLPLVSKIILLLVPTAVSVLNYCFPLSLYFLPDTWVQNIIISELQTQFVMIAAILLIVTGRILAIKSVLNIRLQNTQENDDFDLKTNGLFGYSRNPILVGMYLTYGGIFLLVPNWITIVGFLIYAANMHFRILLEEDFLRSLFGAKFSVYLDKTRRYL